jgi:hypothetical protein
VSRRAGQFISTRLGEPGSAVRTERAASVASGNTRHCPGSCRRISARAGQIKPRYLEPGSAVRTERAASAASETRDTAPAPAGAYPPGQANPPERILGTRIAGSHRAWPSATPERLATCDKRRRWPPLNPPGQAISSQRGLGTRIGGSNRAWRERRERNHATLRRLLPAHIRPGRPIPLRNLETLIAGSYRAADPVLGFGVVKGTS